MRTRFYTGAAVAFLHPLDGFMGMAVQLVLLALAAGFFSGRVSSGGGGGGSGNEVAGNAVRTRAGERAESGEGWTDTAERTDRGKFPSAPGPRMVFHAFQTVDPVLRTQLMGNLMAKMDAGNFREMLAEVERMAIDLGREHNEAWSLMNMRAGQVGGNAAMDHWKTQELDSGPAVETFY